MSDSPTVVLAEQVSRRGKYNFICCVNEFLNLDKLIGLTKKLLLFNEIN